MWSSNVCSTFNRQPQGLFSLAVTWLKSSSFKPPLNQRSSVRQLVASSFYKVRTLLKYAFGKASADFRPSTATLAIGTRAVSNTSASSLSRLWTGKSLWSSRFGNYLESTRFQRINRRHIAGTGLTLGLVGVCLKDDQGYPRLLSEADTEFHFALNDLFHTIKTQSFELKTLREDINSVDRIHFEKCISKGCSGVVYRALLPDSKNSKQFEQPVAVKMLFNYDIESNSTAIINSTLKECIPYAGRFGGVDVRRKKLPPHQNVVKILSVFVDYFQPLDNCTKLYPHALPYNLGGYGRNMTLFVVEKLYDMTLRQYLNLFTPSERSSLAILAQCLDGLEFLYRNEIAHRDLKSDNILVSIREGEDFPWVVISDFGMASTSLLVPFQTSEVCRGGNRALMAPEIVNALPSPSAVLDYHKSDLWAMATIAYEIFGTANPFYACSNVPGGKLNSANYDEQQLPLLPCNSKILLQLTNRMLRRDPSERPTIKFAAETCQLLYHLGENKLQQLASMLDRHYRDKWLEKWLRSYAYRTLFMLMNGADCLAHENKMKLIFFTKMYLNNVKCTIDNMNLYMEELQ